MKITSGWMAVQVMVCKHDPKQLGLSLRSPVSEIAMENCQFEDDFGIRSGDVPHLC